MDEYVLILEVTVEKITSCPLPTEAELNSCPDKFVCFNCLERLPKRLFAGNLSGEHICTRCRPYLGHWAVGALRKFDGRQKKASGGEAKPGRPESVIPEDWELIDDGWVKVIPAPPHTHDIIKAKGVSLKQAKIEEIKRNYLAWRDYAYVHGFPGYHGDDTNKRWNSQLKWKDNPSSTPWGDGITDIIRDAFSQRHKAFEEKPWIWVLPLLILDKGRGK